MNNKRDKIQNGSELIIILFNQKLSRTNKNGSAVQHSRWVGLHVYPSTSLFRMDEKKD